MIPPFAPTLQQFQLPAVIVAQAAALDHQVADLQIEHQKLQAKYAQLQAAFEDLHKQNQRLNATLDEDTTYEGGTEFRRGARTNGKWVPFCAVHQVAASIVEPDWLLSCPIPHCAWVSEFTAARLPEIIEELPQ